MSAFEPTLSPRFVAYVRDYMLDRGLKPREIFASAGLSSDNDSELGAPIPVGQICRLFASASKVLERPYFGLELSAGYHFESSSLLIVAMMAAPNVREALGTLLRYDKYVDSAIETQLSHNGGLSCFEVTVLAPERFETEHLSEYLLSFIAMAMQKATRRALPAKRVAFTHAATKPTLPVSEAFGAPVVYGARQNAIHFEEDFLDEPLRTANDLLFEVACNALRSLYTTEGDHYDFMDVVRRQVLLQFRDGTPTVASVADALQISTRTLRRRLAERGFKLQDVKNDARSQRATFYLQNTSMPLTDIAYELGFSELSAFSRAFKTWTGESPQIFRDAK